MVTLSNFVLCISKADYEALTHKLYSHNNALRANGDAMSAVGVALSELKEEDRNHPKLLTPAQWRQDLLLHAQRALWRDLKPDWFDTHTVSIEQSGPDGPFSLYDRATSPEKDPEQKLLAAEEAAAHRREVKAQLLKLRRLASEVCDDLSVAEPAKIRPADFVPFKAILMMWLSQQPKGWVECIRDVAPEFSPKACSRYWRIIEPELCRRVQAS
jgi:hypothetical protein